MRRAPAAALRRRVIQGFVTLLVAYAMFVLFLDSPVVLVSTSLPGAGAAAAARALHLDGAGEGERAVPVRPLKRPHRDALAERRLSGIVSGLDLRHLNATRSGSLRKVAAEAAAAGARVFSDLRTLATTLTSARDDSSGEHERNKC